MRELKNTEVLAVSGGGLGFVAFAVFSGITTGLGFAGLSNVGAQAALMMIMGTTSTTLLIALL